MSPPPLILIRRLRIYGPEGSGEPAAARDVPDSVAVSVPVSVADFVAVSEAVSVEVSVAVSVALSVAVSVAVLKWQETLKDPGQRSLTPVRGL